MIDLRLKFRSLDGLFRDIGKEAEKQSARAFNISPDLQVQIPNGEIHRPNLDIAMKLSKVSFV
jgi:hypothetical protein